MYHYYIFHKPAGCITALRDENNPTILDYLGSLDMECLRPVGRLDLDTEGLLILTDDGAYNQQMTHPDMGIEKEYFFWALGSFTEEKRKILQCGAKLPGKNPSPARPAKVTILKECLLEDIHDFITGKKREHILKNRPETPVFSGYITVTEGRKHEVKRLLKSVSCCCVYLKRVRMGNVVLPGDLEVGKVREFTP
ncbi:MAG: rRNA pseudouridine synthase [Lachnospiraceae bacterium]|jgi:16S rRNA pseudouridine516 synthase|nr:rRNA pseudouridine synthase [Lachnospiraceae bacterium]